MATKNNKAPGGETGVVQQARSVAGWLGEVVEWIDSAPVFLKPERIQGSAVIHRPRTIADTRSFFDQVREVLDWLEKAPPFVLALFGFGNDRNDGRK